LVRGLREVGKKADKNRRMLNKTVLGFVKGFVRLCKEVCKVKNA
jgi:hypothetical protein